MTGKFSSRQWAVVMFKGFYRQIFCLIANKAVCQAMTIAVPRVNAQRQYFFNISVKVCDLIVSIICTLKQYLVDWSLVAGLISLREVPTYSNSCVVSFTRCDNPAGRWEPVYHISLSRSFISCCGHSKELTIRSTDIRNLSLVIRLNALTDLVCHLIERLAPPLLAAKVAHVEMTLDDEPY